MTDLDGWRRRDESERYRLIKALATARKALGMTQKALAERMGLTGQSQISELESGTTLDFRLSTLQRFARAVNGRIVINLEVSGEIVDISEDRLVEVMRTLTEAVTGLTEAISEIEA